MATYLLRRLLQTLLFVLLAALLIHAALIMLIPGSPYKQYQALISDTEPSTNGPRLIKGLEHDWKLNYPWPVNFFVWLFDPNDTTDVDKLGNTISKGININIAGLHIQGSGALTGDPGRSDRILRGMPVLEALSTRWGNTVALVGLSLVLTLIIAIPIGVISATRPGSRLDHVLTFVSFAGLSLPSFALGLLLIIFFAVLPKQFHDSGWSWLPYLPPGNVVNEGQDNNLFNRLYHLVLPVLALSITQIVWISRYVRSSMLEVLRQDYVRTAWAKGLPQRGVILKHAFRNALIPLATVLGLALPSLAAGAIIVESVFNYSGMGQLYFRAIGGCLTTTHLAAYVCPNNGYPPDYPLALTMTLLLIIITAFSNILTDIVYVLIDPRVNMGAKPA